MDLEWANATINHYTGKLKPADADSHAKRKSERRPATHVYRRVCRANTLCHWFHSFEIQNQVLQTSPEGWELLLGQSNIYFAFLCLRSIVNCIWNSIILYCVHLGHHTCSFSLPFPIMLRNDSKEPCKTRFYEHFLQNVPCKFIVPRMMMLHTACVCAGPVFQKRLQKYSALPGCHMTQQLWDVLLLQICRKWVRRVEWPSCFIAWFERYIIREKCRVSSLALMWRLLKVLALFPETGVKGGAKGSRAGVPIDLC